MSARSTSHLPENSLYLSLTNLSGKCLPNGLTETINAIVNIKYYITVETNPSQVGNLNIELNCITGQLKMFQCIITPGS